MQWIKILVSICLALATVAVNAEIIEIAKFAQTQDYVNEQTLVLLDLDNTVIEPVQLLGSDQWFEHSLKAELAINVAPDAALAKVMAIYVPVQKNTSVVPVEASTPGIIKEFQVRNIIVAGLTTRGAELADVAISQLASVGVSFDVGKFKGIQQQLTQSPASIVQQGVVFANGQHKGKCLLEFLTTINYHPQHIVFVDDKLKNVKQVEEIIVNRHISYYGLRYAYLDAKVKAFNPQIAQLQLKRFQQLMPDHEAEAIISLETASEKT